VLPEEPRTVSPLAKKRSPKRHIDFKNDECGQSTDPLLTETGDGVTSWADMVRNGYQRPNNVAKSNDNSLNKQKKHNDYKESFNKDTSDNSNVHSSNSSREGNCNKCNKETNKCCTEVHVETTKESCNNYTITEVSDFHHKLSNKSTLGSEFPGTVVKDDDEGWEVVSRNRGKPSRRGSYKVQSAMSTVHTFPISSDVSNYADEEEKGSCEHNYGNDHLIYEDDHDNYDNIDLDYHGDNDHVSHSDSDPDHNTIDPDHHVDHHDGNIIPDHHDGNIIPDHHYNNIDHDNAENYCGSDNQQFQSNIIVKGNDPADEDNNENSLQRVIGTSASNVDTDRADSPYMQVSHCNIMIVIINM